MAADRFAGLVLGSALALAWAGWAVAAAPAPTAAPALDKRTARAAQTKGAPTHWWHDGAARRALTLDASLEADFSPALGKPAGTLRPAGSATKSAAPFVSPVLRDASGRARALPGGVLVVLASPVGDDAARALIVRAGAIPVRRLTDRLWLLEGPTGLGSLELANRLQASGVFESAQPNWWIARTLK
jgi:hypothetical protein